MKFTASTPAWFRRSSVTGLCEGLRRSAAGRPAMILLAVGMLAASPAVISASGNTYYRYVNDKGVKVLDDTIPPEFAQKGYEIVSLTGEVIKTVAPAPDAQELARQEANKKLLAEFKRLSRRYSSLADIEAAKQRKLDDIDTNIAIVRGNITGLEAQIENLTAQAADVERAGRAVPDSLLERIAGTRTELVAAKERLQTRLQEHVDTEKRFDTDRELYVKGKALAQSAP